MKTFKDFIVEKNVDTLYHVTKIDNFESIMKHGILRGSSLYDGLSEIRPVADALSLSIEDTEKYLKKNRISKYISFTRHPRNEFTSYNFDFGAVILKFGALKIAKYGKIIPIDYGLSRAHAHNSGEQEERLLLKNKDFINLSDGLINISVIYSHKWVDDIPQPVRTAMAENPIIYSFGASTVQAAFKRYYRNMP